MAGKPGTRPFEPTETDRKLVLSMVAVGTPVDDIRQFIKNPRTGAAIGRATFWKYFQTELAEGSIRANTNVANNLYQIAMGRGPGAVTAAIFWLKCRAHWRQNDAPSEESSTVVEIRGGLPE